MLYLADFQKHKNWWCYSPSVDNLSKTAQNTMYYVTLPLLLYCGCEPTIYYEKK